MMLKYSVWLALTLAHPPRRDERGDVPGWVMVTIMTAGLVTLIWRFAGPELRTMLADALSSVRNP